MIKGQLSGRYASVYVFYSPERTMDVIVWKVVVVGVGVCMPGPEGSQRAEETGAPRK